MYILGINTSNHNSKSFGMAKTAKATSTKVAKTTTNVVKKTIKTAKTKETTPIVQGAVIASTQPIVTTADEDIKSKQRKKRTIEDVLGKGYADDDRAYWKSYHELHWVDRQNHSIEQLYNLEQKNPKNTPRNRIIGWIQEIQESLGQPTEKFDLKDPFLLYQLIKKAIAEGNDGDIIKDFYLDCFYIKEDPHYRSKFKDLYILQKAENLKDLDKIVYKKPDGAILDKGYNTQRDSLIDAIFKVEWNPKNAHYLSAIDKLIKDCGYGRKTERYSDKIIQEWYGTPEDIFKKAMKENVCYLELVKDKEKIGINLAYDNSILLNCINNNEWNEDNKHYLTQINKLFSKKLNINKKDWNKKTLLEKALADKNIYLLELLKDERAIHTFEADNFLSKIKDENIREKFLEYNVAFPTTIYSIKNCKNVKEFEEMLPERLKELKSPFWKPEVQGKELMEALFEAKPSVDMIIKICTSLREYLPKN